MAEYRDIDLLWIVLCAFLVFMMQLGFALLETGTVRAKNTINVAMKNLIDTIFGIIYFWLIGFGLMFGSDFGGLFGTSHFLIDGRDMAQNGFFFFQVMFAATAVTIVSGAVAERMKFNGYVLVAVIVISLIYPIFGHWAWGEGGWLKSMGFVDFAGSTVVHSVGGWIGLAGAIVLGPRLGKFRKGKIIYFSPSNHNFIVFGVFILWFAWFGFNAGSLLAFDAQITVILLNTLVAGAFGGCGAYIISLFVKQRVAVEIFSFGIIAGLVGITAGCASVSVPYAALIGLISAPVMFFFDQLLQRRYHVDDPLSVVSIHGFVGAWGTFSVGLFGTLPEGMTRPEFIAVQSTGIASAFIFAFGSGLLLFTMLRGIRALRVSKRNEVIGLNVAEHQAKLPWVETVESIIRIMRTGDLHGKVHEERDTEVGIVAKFFNYLLEIVRDKEVALEHSNHRLAQEAVTDTLTGIMNRRGLLNRFEGHSPYHNDSSLIIIDIDKFKTLNDTYGHNIGDTILYELSQRIQRSLRTEDLFARWGGEEFVVAVRSLDLSVVQEIAEKLRRHVEHTPFPRVGQVTCSFGVSSPKHAGVTFDELFEQADKALYQAKELGRNRVCSW